MPEPTQPKQCFDSGCPLAGVAKGWVAGCGNPETAKYAMILESPGREEISFEIKPNPNRAFLQTQAECDREIDIRKRQYPDIQEKWLKIGAPVVGASGGALLWWVFPKIGMRREEWFIDNTIRCRLGNNEYPTGKTKKEAEKCCRQYDRIGLFRPNTFVFSLHPASLLRSISPLTIAIKDMEKVRDFTQQGRRVVALLGGKATSAFARYGSNVTKWRGDYRALKTDWAETYKALFEFVKPKRKKVDKKVNMLDDIFCVPETVTKRAKERKTRSIDVRPGTCKTTKRHTHNRPPKCGFAGCWDAYELKQGDKNEISNIADPNE